MFLGKGFKARGDMLKFFAILVLTLEYLLENEEFQVSTHVLLVLRSVV